MTNDAPELDGRRIVLTRRAEDEGELRAALEARGAEVISTPAIRVVPVAIDHPDRRLLDEPARYTHVVFTSANAVRSFVEALEAAREGHERDARSDVRAGWEHARTACVGPRTEAALASAGWPVHYTARGGSGLALAHELLDEERLGPHHHVLLPQSESARSELAATLEAAEVRATAAVLYATEAEAKERASELEALVAEGERPDAVVFFSPSAVRGFLTIISDRVRRAIEAGSVAIISIGPTTSAAARSAGFEVAAEAGTPSVEAVVGALEETLGGG